MVIEDSYNDNDQSHRNSNTSHTMTPQGKRPVKTVHDLNLLDVLTHKNDEEGAKSLGVTLPLFRQLKQVAMHNLLNAKQPEESRHMEEALSD